MLNVSDVVADADLQAPRPFLILRSTGQFVAGGFQSNNVTQLQAYGQVQRATPKELEMLPEADRIKAVMAFWWTQPIYVTTGKAAVPSIHGETPQGAGTTYTLSVVPPGGSVNFYRNGMLQKPGVDYMLVGTALSLTIPTGPLTVVYATWPITVDVGTNAADLLQYPAVGDRAEKYRVLDVKHYPGSGYWKALATRISAM